MKSGSGSAVAFGRVLQAVRKHLSKNQADVASSFGPKLSVAAVSMAESGNRPPKTEAIVRGYAAALELDEDALLDLWWAMQGMVALESEAEERVVKQWWRELRPGLDASLDLHRAETAAKTKWTPNDDYYAPSAALFALADAICGILARMLGNSWKVSYKAEIGLREPFDGYLAVVNIKLQAQVSDESLEMMATFACPEPVTRPFPAELMRAKPQGGSSPDVGWIFNALMTMPARERAAVAGFIHGLREGSSLYGAGEDK
ncbi:helix-turn-helix domain-containing protein [Streptosporangium subroseum]|uniref:helix-turn-helix domain-containing protein n=1 Tax=Streptosporangium subroseum TaxID=106412 RepID=UPI003086FB5E|nr:helix-turn-helix transcriptional regulator [Streptosporangium subroseum]